MRKRPDFHIYLSAILIAAILFSLLAVYATSLAAEKSHPSVSARAATLYEPETRSFLFEKNADCRLPMASTTKIMTALVVAEECKLSDKVQIDSRAVGTEGSSAYLKEGDVFTVEELLHALLLQSANDAAAALAYHVSDGISEFATLMNEKATSLGLVSTHFDNPHGLDSEEHYTTAKELAIIAAAAIENDTVSRIVATYKRTFIQGERTRTYVNHNKLLKKYEGCIGLKTGFTKKCGRCLVSAAKKDDLTFIAVTLDAPDDWNDHKELLDYGYNSLEKITLAGIGDYSFNVKILGGDKNEISVTNEQELSVILPRGKYVPESFIELPRFCVSPIKKGESLGRVIFTAEGRELGRIELIAQESSRKKKERFWGIF